MKRIAITGATGFLGSALTTFLQQRGDEVVPISRKSLPGGVVWNPEVGVIEREKLEGVDAVIHLAGENLADGRWTDARKRALGESRVQGTRLIAETVSRLERPPRVLISASAIGVYGDRGDEVLDEDSAVGKDFLADLVTAWEAAAEPAREAGIRVVHPRFGIILSSEGGALARMLPPFRLGVGGPFGGGHQWMSWVAIDDVLSAIAFLIETETMRGPVNIVAPEPVRNAEFAKALGKRLERPWFVPAPAFALRLLLGEMADAALLSSARVVPGRLREAGFRWGFGELGAALRHVV